MTATCLHSRALIRLSAQESGENARDFLQGLVSNDVSGELPVWTGLLTPQGKVLFDFIVWQDESDLLIDCEADAADALIKRLSMYRLRRKIAIARDDAIAVNWSVLPGSDPRLPALGTRWLDTADAANLPADAAWLSHRLSLGITEGQAELGDGTTLWLECNAAELNGVSFTKGCYVGQENTARMNWRQKVNRRLIVVPIGQSDPARQRVAYPDLGVAVDHCRLEDIPASGNRDWFQTV